MTFLNEGLCAVYLILDEDEFDQGKIKIEAYFTLSHKSLITPQVSKTKIRNAARFPDAESIHFVLIGQLGKYIAEDPELGEKRSDITSGEILDYAFEIIRASSSLIPCRCAMVECSDNPKVQQVYTNYGFSFFQYDGEHHQFYKRV